MSPRRRQVVAEPELETGPSAAELEIENRMAALKQAAGVGGKIRVVRVKPDGTRPTCGWITPDQIDEEYIAQRWGGGKFIVEHRPPNGEYGAQITIELDDSLRPSGSPASSAPVAVPVSGVTMTDAERENLVLRTRLEERDRNGGGGGGAAKWLTPEGLTAIASVVGALFAGMRNLAGGDP